MDFISEYFYVIILIVGAIAQWMKSRSESREENGRPNDAEDLEEMIGREERRQSRPAVPPPLARPLTPPPLPASGHSPAPELRRKSREVAPAFDTSGELARQQALAEKVKVMKQARAARKAGESLPSGKESAGSATRSAGLGLRDRLRNRNELRQAFVLKEIIEKPVALR
jgi:hypothetical protein